MSLRANSLIPQSTHSEFDWKLEVVGKEATIMCDLL